MVSQSPHRQRIRRNAASMLLRGGFQLPPQLGALHTVETLGQSARLPSLRAPLPRQFSDGQVQPGAAGFQ
eukprot:EST44702.1 Hypothetical protein SS50377_15414 [Spironucleus salmonicida]